MRVIFDICFLFIAYGLLVSCHEKNLNDRVQTIDSDQCQIINLILAKIIEPDTALRNREKERIMYDWEHPYEDFLYSKQQIDSLLAVVDKSPPAYVVIADSLQHLQNDNWGWYLREIVAPNEFVNQFFNIDTAYQPLMQVLIDFKKNVALDTLNIRLPYPYKIGFARTQQHFQRKYNDRWVAWITFSRIVLNASQDRACIHVNYNCGQTCGQSGFYFLRKKKEGWLYDGYTQTGIH